MELFVKHYNQYIKKHKLKHSEKNLINFKKFQPYKKEEKEKEKMLHVMTLECHIIIVLHV